MDRQHYYENRNFNDDQIQGTVHAYGYQGCDEDVAYHEVNPCNIEHRALHTFAMASPYFGVENYGGHKYNGLGGYIGSKQMPGYFGVRRQIFKPNSHDEVQDHHPLPQNQVFNQFCWQFLRYFHVPDVHSSGIKNFTV